MSGRHGAQWRDSFVLACGASPATYTTIKQAQEYAQTEAAVRGVTHADSMRHDTKRALILHTWSTVESLRTDLVEYRPLVLHISSHASEYEIILAEDAAANRAKALGVDELMRVLKVLRGSTIPYPEVVVLNGCFTEDIAKELADIRTGSSPDHGPFVIGTTMKVYDYRAVNFTKVFYRTLAVGQSLGTAFELARASADHQAYFLHSGGRGPSDFEAANKYFVPPDDYMIIPIPTRYGSVPRRYELLVTGARFPLTFARFRFTGENSREPIVAMGMEFNLDQLPLVGAEDISAEANHFLAQEPRHGVPNAVNKARYFVNHLRAITSIRRGACIFACYGAAVYYEQKGEWIKYSSAGHLVADLRRDPVEWGRELKELEDNG